LDDIICKCGDKDCLGWILLHEKETNNMTELKELLIDKHGDVQFKLKDNPSSGELFTKFYELHVIKDNKK
jgi:hypothetical protein